MSKTATERLRELLDERGVKWTYPKSATEHIQTTFLFDGWCVEVLERPIGLCVNASNLFDTPEQATAAMLGNADEPVQDEQDTREKLEADIEDFISVSPITDDSPVNVDYWRVRKWLDRQASITERHWMEICGANTAANIELKRQIDELEAKRDELKAELKKLRHRYFTDLVISDKTVAKLEAENAELQEKADTLEEENRLMREKFRNTFNNDVTVFGMKLDEVRNLIAENAELKDDNDSLRDLIRFMRVAEAKGGGMTQLALTSKCPMNGEKRNGERCLTCRWCVGTGGEWWCAWNMREEL